MDRAEFLEKIKDIFQTDEDITFDTILDDLNEWDSLAKISIIAFMSHDFNKKVSVNDLNNAKTVNDLAKLAGI